MKIKNTKRMNEKELLHYIIDNTEICDIKYKNDGGGNTDITLDLKKIGENLKFNYVRETGLSDALYDVEVEEEITEDTVFKELICLDVDGEYDHYDNVSVSGFVICAIKAIYIPNDDLNLTLIWTKEKGLVE